ncbi:hypothetical protein [Sandaracinus amylolyticus]|uniref:hypothetical protein n=1 Tax=Sandaracinus amylolyticus TaxID=927083 RepID=UPI001F3AF07D|nr:hypothetical protein [Sandaracinus amylolyticus]UJR85633.1 Hypothetical protein I5071_77130 [Sandaracinus amylolyticus]
MQAQCRREDLDPTSLSKTDVERLVPHLATVVARFTSPEKGEQVADALRAPRAEGAPALSQRSR